MITRLRAEAIVSSIANDMPSQREGAATTSAAASQSGTSERSPAKTTRVAGATLHVLEVLPAADEHELRVRQPPEHARPRLDELSCPLAWQIRPRQTTSGPSGKLKPPARGGAVPIRRGRSSRTSTPLETTSPVRSDSSGLATAGARSR